MEKQIIKALLLAVAVVYLAWPSDEDSSSLDDTLSAVLGLAVQKSIPT